MGIQTGNPKNIVGMYYDSNILGPSILSVFLLFSLCSLFGVIILASLSPEPPHRQAFGPTKGSYQDCPPQRPGVPDFRSLDWSDGTFLFRTPTDFKAGGNEEIPQPEQPGLLFGLSECIYVLVGQRYECIYGGCQLFCIYLIKLWMDMRCYVGAVLHHGSYAYLYIPVYSILRRYSASQFFVSLYLSIYLSGCLSIYSFISLFGYVYVYIYIHVYIYMCMCICVCICVYISICMPM